MLKIGHRGARAYAPENTITSFKKAVEMGVDAIELDVRRTKDGQIVVIHDEDVKRTTNGSGLVSELTLDQVKSFKTEGNETIPTLDEALEFIGKKVKIILELKETGTERQVLDCISQKKLLKNVVLASFLEDALKKVHEINPDVETGLIYAKHKNPLKAALDLNAKYLLAFYRFVHTANVQKAHESGLKLIAWTINTREEAETYAKKGVDGIATDKPDILKEIK